MSLLPPVSESDSEPSAKVNEELKTKTLGPLPVGEYNSEDDEYPEYVIESDSVFDWNKVILRPIFPHEPLGDIDCWYRYLQQIKESEGFDIKDYPGLGSMTTIVPKECNEKRSAYAARALVDYNEKNGTEYKFNEIVKVNGYMTAYSHFYITFTVTNMNGEKEYFQAEVMEDLDGNLEFPIVRPRAKKDKDI